MTKKSKGASPILFVGIVAVIAAIVGYYLYSQGKLPIGTSTLLVPKATENDFAFITDPLIRKHLAAQSNVTSYRSKTHDLIGTKGSFNVFEVQIKGADMAAFYNWHEDDGKKGGELISIGETTYIKDYNEGKWWKQTVKPEEKPKNKDEGEREPKDFTEDLKEMQAKPLTYEKLGEESCGSLTCYKYKEVDVQTPEASRIFWFDKSKFLLRKEESGFGEWRGTTEYTYDAINIGAPSPTKDVPEGRNIYEYLGTGAPVGGSGLPSSATGGSIDSGIQPQYDIPDVPQDMPVDSGDSGY